MAASDVEDRRGAMVLENAFSEMTVLIVMNDDPRRECLKNMIRDFGVLSLLTAHDVEDGLSRLGEKPVDVVIGDYGLKPVNGLEFARRIRHGEGAADPATPIIMLAAGHERSLIEAAHDIGVNGFIDKSLSPSSVYSRMLSATADHGGFIHAESYIGPDRRESRRRVIGVTMTPSLPETPFIRSAHNDIQTIIRALDEATRNPARRRQAMRSIGSLAGFIMEQGNKANYPLMSSIAESLRNACRRAPMPNLDQLEVVKSHINAMAAWISDEIDGNGRSMDGAILDLLCGSDRQQNVHPRPVIWPRASA